MTRKTLLMALIYVSLMSLFGGRNGVVVALVVLAAWRVGVPCAALPVLIRVNRLTGSPNRSEMNSSNCSSAPAGTEAVVAIARNCGEPEGNPSRSLRRLTR